MVSVEVLLQAQVFLLALVYCLFAAELVWQQAGAQAGLEEAELLLVVILELAVIDQSRCPLELNLVVGEFEWAQKAASVWAEVAH